MSSHQRQVSYVEDSWIIHEDDNRRGSSNNGQRNGHGEALLSGSNIERRSKSNVDAIEPELIMPAVGASWMNESEDFGPLDSPLKRETRSRKILHKSRSPLTRHNFSTVNAIPRQKTPSINASNASQVLHGQLIQTTLEYLRIAACWARDVVGGALRVLKTPISYLLAIWLLFGALLMMQTLVTDMLYASLSPLCRIPGISILNVPFCTTNYVDKVPGTQPAIEFDQLMTVQAQFEQVLQESVSGISLPVDMKRGEAGIRDLRQLVRYSQLSSRDELVLEFDGFIETARIASFDLQRFNSHVGRAVDSVISTTRWTTRVLDEIQQHVYNRGWLDLFINDRMFAPFQPTRFTEDVLLDQYIQHTRLVEEEIQKLITEAQAIVMVLAKLEDRLEVIHRVATRDGMHAKALKAEILSELWTMVGGNKGKLHKMDRQLILLQQVGFYRKTAYTHLSATIVRLQAISAGLEDLRERVGAPELLRDKARIPLSVHIENIQLGLDRLELSRQTARHLENEHIKKTLERDRLEAKMIDAK